MSNSHGHTTAAWTAVTIMFVGFLISGLALPFALEWLFFLGLLVVVLGAVVGKVMQMMGMGNTVTYKDGRDPEYAEQDEKHADHSDERSTDRQAAGSYLVKVIQELNQKTKEENKKLKKS